VDVLVAGSPGGVKMKILDGMRIISARCLLRILSNPLCPGFGKHISRSDADIIHFHLPLPTAVISWLLNGKFGSRPYVVTYHSDIVRQAFVMPFYGPFLKKFLRKADRIIATSRAYVESSRWIRDLPNVSVVPIGADPGKFKVGRPDEREDFFLFVGRFRKYKGIGVLLDAWRSMPDHRLTMVGGGPLLPMMRKRIESENLNVSIVTDASDDVLAALYGSALALILPSTLRSEAFGMVQVEAMFCGTPVISTSIDTGVPWVNKDSVSGLTIEPGDSTALVSAVGRILDDDEWSRLSQGARERAVTLFDGPKLMSRIEGICIEVLDDWQNRS